MKLDRNKIREVILEELLRSDEPTSEMKEFSSSKPGQKVMRAGEKIKNAGKSVHELSREQTGNMRKTLENISEFVYKVGEALAGIDTLDEDEGSIADRLPSTQELKKLYKEIQKLERI